MSAQIIDGKAVAAEVTARVKQRVEALKAKGVTVGLAVILAGEDPASQVYVRNKIKKCAELGIESRRIDLPADVTMETMLETRIITQALTRNMLSRALVKMRIVPMDEATKM